MGPGIMWNVLDVYRWLVAILYPDKFYRFISTKFVWRCNQPCIIPIGALKFTDFRSWSHRDGDTPERILISAGYISIFWATPLSCRLVPDSLCFGVDKISMVFSNIKIIKPGPVLNLIPIYIHGLAVSSIFASLLPAFAAYLRYLPIFDLGLSRSIAVLS